MSAPSLLVAALRAAAAPRRSSGRLSRRLRAAAVRALVPPLLARGRLSDALDAIAGASAPGDRQDPRRVVQELSRLPISCLHRAVSAWAIARAQGEELRLVLGVRQDAATRLVAHAWIERDGEPLGEPPGVRRRYAVAYEHPPRPRPPHRSPEPRMNHAKPGQDVILTELEDGTGVLLHLGTRFYYALNRTGVAAWKLLASGEARTADEVSSALSLRFAGASPDTVRRDVDALLRELRDEGLLAR